MNKTILMLFVTLIFFNIKAFSQTSSTFPKKWGIETELIQPLIPDVGIIRIQATRTITADQSKLRGNLLIGAYIRPNVKHNIVEKINEYLLIIGYRQFLWKGLHLETKSNLGYSWGTKNLEDGKDYNNLSWFWEANVGYKFNFLKKQKFNFYINPQFGILSSITADIGPRDGNPDTFIHGNLLFGVNF